MASLKLAIAGKGGVGKTLVAATLSRLFARDGFRVLAVDADPAMNLAYAIGIPADVASKLIPIADNEKLIEEKTGAKPGGSFGTIFSLTPSVDDIAERVGILGPDGARLLVMGTVRSGGSGCLCPANALLRALIAHITLERKDVVVMDMEAGLEHFGRGTVRGIDALVAVVESSAQSIYTCKRIKELSSDIGVREVLAVANKVSSVEERRFVLQGLKELDLEAVCTIPFDPTVPKADMQRIAVLDFAPLSPAVSAIRELEETLKERYRNQYSRRLES